MSGFLNNNFKTIFIISKSHFKQQIRKCNTLHKVQFENASNIEDTNSSQKLLRVAVIGMPNAGKSTFINHLMDRKVCMKLFSTMTINYDILGVPHFIQSPYNTNQSPCNIHRQ